MIERKIKTIKMSYEVASKNLLKLNNILIIIIIITLFLLCYAMFVSLKDINLTYILYKI